MPAMHDETTTLFPLDGRGDTGAIILPPGFGDALTAIPRPRGHQAKITAALDALGAAGHLPPYLSQCEVRRRCEGWLRAQGLRGHEIPSRSSWQRHLAKRR